MKTIYIVALLCAFGCSRVDDPTPADAHTVQDNASVTLDNLVYVDPASATTQHPLVCGAGRDFPTGHELAFRNAQSREFVHAVFAKGVTSPSKLTGKLVLHGRYQTIQNKQIYTHKQPADDYRYFVVSSWEHKK